ncbi:MAG: imuA [Gammaproteobacteria bacterium]|jgi:protein ImuA|nr:imuA [Gammaproteobacteria bacterium]
MAVITNLLIGKEQGTEQVISQMPHAIWRGNQMASYRAPTLTSGFPRLDAELPHAGWPQSALIELLIQQPGIGEIQLLKPVLVSLARSGRRIALIQPPHLPQMAAFQSWGISTGQLLWIKSKRATDALWAAGQILHNGSCGAVLLWQTYVHSTTLRRLHLAAQETSTTFWMIRPMSNAQDASPASLRLILRPASGGIGIDLIKRRGPPSAAPFYVWLPGMPSLLPQINKHHAIVDRHTPAITASGSITTVLV